MIGNHFQILNLEKERDLSFQGNGEGIPCKKGIASLFESERDAIKARLISFYPFDPIR